MPRAQQESGGDHPVADPGQRRPQPHHLHGVQHGLQASHQRHPGALLRLLQAVLVLVKRYLVNSDEDVVGE